MFIQEIESEGSIIVAKGYQTLKEQSQDKLYCLKRGQSLAQRIELVEKEYLNKNHDSRLQRPRDEMTGGKEA